MKGNRIPNYYIGKRYKIEARKVIEDFDLSYNTGTAVTYLLRAERKHESPIECIQKAINHLEFELDKLKR
jgi:ribosome-associated translation inhibitor RaiA|tara:strand:+ start:1915 stop:2124 length:210 start_codon:yes stop_codon:yes gene_type:complete